MGCILEVFVWCRNFRGDFITWVHAVVLGTDEIINFEVNCELSTQQSIRDSDGIGFGTFTFFRIVGRVLNEELMMSRSVVRRGSTSAQVSD